MEGSASGASRDALTAGEVAALVGGRLTGDSRCPVTRVMPIRDAGAGEMAFLVNRRYLRFLKATAAGSFLVTPELDPELPRSATRVVVEHGHDALRRIMDALFPPEVPPAGIHPTAVIGREVRIGVGVGIGPYAVVGDRAVLGDGCHVGAHCVIGADSVVGAASRLHPQVVLYPHTHLGARVVIHSGTRLGADGFGYAFVDGAHRKMPQAGRCIIGDDVEIGANSAVDRGSLGDTVVEPGAKIDNLVQVGHNVRVGALSLLAALSGVAGSTRIGRGVWIGGQVGVIDQLELGDGAKVAFGSIVTRDVQSAETVSGHPARPHREQLRTQAQVGRISQLTERVRQLEEELERLRASGPGS